MEKKWRKFWASSAEATAAKDDSDKPKKYILVEFPYPSGSGLHVGHAFSFTGADVYARFKRMQGYNVLFPMGWDAFGLPTENYAIKTKQKPQKVTADNTAMFKRQMQELAFSFDWSREINTTDPLYYRWTQWIFVKLFEKGLAYKEEMPINWCPSCKIGLANEEVVNDKCERCGHETERRTISQWVVKITDYANKLAEGLGRTDFIEKVKLSQINWIGKKEGINIDFEVKGTDQKLTVFTTTPVNFGATFLVVAPEHQFVQDIVAGKYGVGSGIIEEIKKYMMNARKKSDIERTELGKEKTGVFSGLTAINHVNNKEIPIWITDFVLANYGTGAVQGCPGHDQRDWDFAKKYDIPIPQVVDIPGEHIDVEKQCFQIHAGDKGVMVNSDFLNGIDFTEAMQKTMDYFESKGWGKRVVSYHLRDWIFSRQHYWGEPIPMIFCTKCAENQLESLKSKKFESEDKRKLEELNAGWVSVPEDQLPVVLPEVEAYEPTNDGKSPLSKIDGFVKTTCPKCGGEASRETDTMPNWAGSDWYYLAYLLPNIRESESPKSQKSESKDVFLDNLDKIKYWMPVDVYIGGDEHNTLHLLYSRFIYKFLFDLGVLPNDEPYQKRISHGVILGPDGQRMSKSHGNVIVPEEVSKKYGVDVVRCYLMFMGPFDGTMAWNEKTLMGVKRFLDRFHNYFKQKIVVNASNDNVLVLANKTIDFVTKELESFKYNTAIAKMMEMLNRISNVPCQISKKELKTMIKLIAPLAPYMAEELWNQIREETDPISVHVADWPKAEEKYLVEDTITIVVAVNGKGRGQMQVDSSKVQKVESKGEIIAKAKELETVKKWIEGKKIVREIYVEGKMVNLVVED